MNRRSGITLAEVLIAIFVLSIGLMGIMALFPLGAMHMAQAIKDDRCGVSESNATSVAHFLWKDQVVGTPNQWQRDPLCRNDNNPNQNGPLPKGYPYSPMVGPNAPWIDPDPNGPNGPLVAPQNIAPFSILPALSTANYNTAQQSYPVLVDGIGWFSNGGLPNAGAPQVCWVGGNQISQYIQYGLLPQNAYLTIPRRSLRSIETQQSLQAKIFWYNRTFVLLDDLSFGRDGVLSGVSKNPDKTVATATLPQPANPQGSPLAGTVQRDGRYSTAWMIRRSQVFLDTQAELTVIVYSGRSLGSSSGETVIPGNFFQMQQNSTELIIDWGCQQLIQAGKPKIKKGTWILDATMVSANGQPEPHGYFYRVISVTELGGTLMSLELQQPARVNASQTFPFPNGSPNNPNGMLIIMDNVSEVFERKTLSPNIVPGQ
jgi:hypothetical protein